MGCSGSKAADSGGSSPLEKEASVKEASLQHTVHQRGTNSVHILNAAETTAVHDIFDEYRKESQVSCDATERISSAGHKHKAMTREGLRSALGKDMDAGLFDFLWTLFDADGSGYVDADEFVMTMALLSKGIDSTEAQLEALFIMFDSNKSDELSKDEFEALVQATVSLNLDHLLESTNGAKVFEAQLTKEYSEENLAFWQAVRAYRAIEDGEARAARARELEQEFVAEGSMRQVNLPNGVQKALLTAIAEYGSNAPIDLFDVASDEIFRLMEKDTFARFKNDPGAIADLVSACTRHCQTRPPVSWSPTVVREWWRLCPGLSPAHIQPCAFDMRLCLVSCIWSTLRSASFHPLADYAQASSKSGTVTFESFKQWATSEPSVFILLNSLCNNVKSLLQQRAGNVVGGSGAKIAQQLHGSAIGNPENQHV